MGEIPDKARPRSKRRKVVGSIKTGLHSVTVQMKRPSRFVPLMIALGLGAFATFGWPLFAWTQGPQVTLNERILEALVDVHRGAAPPATLNELKDVKALVAFEALPKEGPRAPQGSLAVLRASRVSLSRPLITAFDVESDYETSLKGVEIRVRNQEESIHVLIGRSEWPKADGPKDPLQ